MKRFALFCSYQPCDSCIYSKQSMYGINDGVFSIQTYLINKKSTCYLWTVILRVDHRNTPTGRSVIYCLNKMFSQSCPRIEGKLNKTDFAAEFPPSKCAIKKVLITGKLHQNLLMIVYP